MKPVDVKAPAPSDRDTASRVRSFFRSLGKGDWKAASRMAADPIDLFGKQVARAELAKGKDRSLGRALERLDELPRGELDPEHEAALLGGPLGLDDQVFFAQLKVGDVSATYGVVVCAQRAEVVRLFDPSAFKAWASAASDDEDDEDN